jgi:hypothetical protein
MRCAAEPATRRPINRLEPRARSIGDRTPLGRGDARKKWQRCRSASAKRVTYGDSRDRRSVAYLAGEQPATRLKAVLNALADWQPQANATSARRPSLQRSASFASAMRQCIR